MHRFYADPAVSGSDIVSLDRDDAYHAAKVLRLHSGDSVEIVISGVRHAGEVRDVSDSKVTISVQGELPSTETRIRFVLFQGIPKGDKMEFIVQKATELGVSDVVPVMMARSVVKIDPKDRIRKQERWQKIAREAGKQSGRCVIPEIHAPVSVRETADMIRKLDAVAVPWESGRDFGPLAFAKAHPELKPDDIPQEVWEDIFQTNNLEASYIKYQAKKTKDENAFLKKNAENKARSTGSMKSAGKPTYDEFDRMWYEDDY